MKWIKIEDKLPEEGVNVLVYDETVGICVGCTYFCSWSHHPIGSFACDGCLFNVTHWMDLPPGPIEGEE